MNVVRSTNNNNNNTINHHNNQQACAACKYQRKKCAPDCILAPYFPHDRQRQFLNAHKLFGVRNITKIIENLNDPHQRNEAMRSIIFHSDMRAVNPVGGCCTIIQDLMAQIQYHEAELDLILQQLAIFRAQQTTTRHHDVHLPDHYASSLLCGPNNSIIAAVPSPVSNYQCAQPLQVPMNNNMVVVKKDVDDQSSNGNNVVANNLYHHQDDVNNYWTAQDSMSLSSLSLQNKNGGVEHNIDSYVGDHEAYNDCKPSSSMLDIHRGESF